MNKYKRTIIACESIKDELKKVFNGEKSIKLKFLPINFHRKPGKLTGVLQQAIDKAAEHSESIVLGYGLCSNATVGLTAPGIRVMIPRTHDCISMYLGGQRNYKKFFFQYPGTYFLTKSWIDNQKDPLGLVENEYQQRVGDEMAKEAMDTELKNYNYIGFINNQTGNTPYYKNKSIENAQFFDKEYIELEGSDTFIKKILYGPYDTRDFVILEPYQTSKQNQFLT